MYVIGNGIQLCIHRRSFDPNQIFHIANMVFPYSSVYSIRIVHSKNSSSAIKFSALTIKIAFLSSIKFAMIKSKTKLNFVNKYPIQLLSKTNLSFVYKYEVIL